MHERRDNDAMTEKGNNGAADDRGTTHQQLTTCERRRKPHEYEEKPVVGWTFMQGKSAGIDQTNDNSRERGGKRPLMRNRGRSGRTLDDSCLEERASHHGKLGDNQKPCRYFDLSTTARIARSPHPATPGILSAPFSQSRQ